MANQIVNSNAYTTAYLASEAGWADDNLPDELFQMEPHPGWGLNALPNLVDVNGNPFGDDKGRVFKDFPIPVQISIRPEDWRLQMYTDRLDPRIQKPDLHFRMIPGPNDTLLTTNAMNMQKLRLRKGLNLPCWTRRREEPEMLDCLIHESLSLNSVRHNTVLEVHSFGMIKPTLGAGINPQIPSTPIPLDRFLLNNQIHVPSEGLEGIFNCIAELQDKAFDNQCSHWIFLENRHKPTAWRQRAPTNRAGPTDITFPSAGDMPQKAVEWIKNCVWEAAAMRQPVPDLSRIPNHAVTWVRDCVEEGREHFEAGGNDNYLGIDHLVWPIEEWVRMGWDLAPPEQLDNEYNNTQTTPPPAGPPLGMTAEEWDSFMQGDWW